MKNDENPIGTPIYAAVCPKCRRVIGSLTQRWIICCREKVWVGHAAIPARDAATSAFKLAALIRPPECFSMASAMATEHLFDRSISDICPLLFRSSAFANSSSVRPR